MLQCSALNCGQDEDPVIREKIIDLEMDIEEVEEDTAKKNGKMRAAEKEQVKIRRGLLKLGVTLSGRDREEEPSHVLIVAFRSAGGTPL